MTPQDRLIEIAQRLDEMSGDGASELQTLSTELGEIAEKWPDPAPRPAERGPDPVPRYLREIDGIVRRAIEEGIYGHRETRGRFRDPMEHRMYAEYAMQRVMPTLSRDEARGIFGGTI